ncbi:hypothetical protein [Imhoffiella purpurea]|uniref:hypothetical protein n=1 Tax=Imhoffiella purpurea TaxID=1249627 RepID=UPI0005C182D9|nr:hypothetical protein [Imhoffiella purpurea]
MKKNNARLLAIMLLAAAVGPVSASVPPAEGASWNNQTLDLKLAVDTTFGVVEGMDMAQLPGVVVDEEDPIFVSFCTIICNIRVCF